MKKTLLIVGISFMALAAKSQKFQATIKKGSTDNTVVVYIKPNGAISGQISSMQFAVAVPKTISATRPGFSISSSVTGLTYGGTGLQETEDAVAGTLSYVYTFSGVGDATVPNTDYISGTEYKIAEVSLFGTSDPATIRLVQLPEGGDSKNSNFYMSIGGNDVVNEAAQFYGTAPVNDGASYSGTSYVSLSGFTLPVNFLSFYALKNNNSAKLSWTVENDLDNKYFEIERSNDGRSYSFVTRITAFDNGKSVNTYEIADAAGVSGTVYYRIKQVDKNGTVTYSVIRNLNFDKNNLALSLFPNPARSTTKLVLDAVSAGKATISIRDVTGKQVQLHSVQLVKGINQQQLNVQTLPAGEYNVTVLGAGINSTIKLSRIN